MGTGKKIKMVKVTRTHTDLLLWLFPRSGWCHHEKMTKWTVDMQNGL